MLTIKVWCLPDDLQEERLKVIHQDLVAAVTSIPLLQEMGLKDQNSMLVLFPPDRMKYGLGEEILVEATDLEVRQVELCNDLAAKLGMAVHKHFPKAKIACKVSPRSWGDGKWEL